MNTKQVVPANAPAPKWNYRATAEHCFSPEIGCYHTYGIQAEGRVANRWTVLETVHDVAVNRDVAEKTAILFTKHQLSPIHLLDALEDFLV